MKNFICNKKGLKIGMKFNRKPVDVTKYKGDLSRFTTVNRR